MKRRFFPLMVAALAAVSSLTCFSGCTGGGEKEGAFIWKSYRNANIELGFLSGSRITFIPSGDVYYENELVCVQDDCTLTMGSVTVSLTSRLQFHSVKIENGKVVDGKATLDFYPTEGGGEEGATIWDEFKLGRAAGEWSDNGYQNLSEVNLSLQFSDDGEHHFEITGVINNEEVTGTSDHFYVHRKE